MQNSISLGSSHFTNIMLLLTELPPRILFRSLTRSNNKEQSSLETLHDVYSGWLKTNLYVFSSFFQAITLVSPVFKVFYYLRKVKLHNSVGNMKIFIQIRFASSLLKKCETKEGCEGSLEIYCHAQGAYEAAS